MSPGFTHSSIGGVFPASMSAFTNVEPPRKATVVKRNEKIYILSASFTFSSAFTSPHERFLENGRQETGD